MSRRDAAGALLETHLPLPNRRRGKVRDLYDCPLPDGSDGVLLVATDRVSAFDVVMANGVPGKGRLLTAIARFWFDHFRDRVAHHLVTTDPAAVPGLSAEQRRELEGRMMLCGRYRVVPVECVARGHLAGSGWQDYRKTGTVCGIALPPGLERGAELPEPLFTPATKAASGHDQNISFAEAAERVGHTLMHRLRELTLDLYGRARDHARRGGLLLADTKLEFGLEPGTGRIVLIDEIFTPDSSRYWPMDEWRPGVEPDSFDKQIVRNHLQALCDAGRWDKTPPGPELPAQVVERTRARYAEALDRLTGIPA